VPIIWTKHAQDRQKEWQAKLGITREDVELVLSAPEQVVPGDRDILMAHSRRGNGLIRVAFTQSEADKRIVSIYWTSKMEKYWRVG